MATLSHKGCSRQFRISIVLFVVGFITIIYLHKNEFLITSTYKSETTSTRQSETTSTRQSETTSTRQSETTPTRQSATTSTRQPETTSTHQLGTTSTNESETVSTYKSETTSTISINITSSPLRTGKIVLLFWSKYFGGSPSFFEVNLPKGDKEGECPVACEVTSDHQRAKDANGFIVHSRDPYPLPPSKDVPWILTGLENPVYTPVLSDGNYMSQFQLSRSYRLDSDFPTPLFTKPNLDPPVPFEKRTGGIIATFSHCEPVRTAYLRHLMKHVHVDSYGGCLHNKDGMVGRWAPNHIESKQDVEKSYKFVIVFFNQDCDYYVDEKILNALNVGAIPVVMSTDKIYDFLPGNLKNAIINVRDFKSPKELAERLKFLMNNKIEYNKFLEWKVKGLGHINDTVIGRYWESKFRQWCYVCQGVADGKGHKEGLKPDFCKPRDYKDLGITP
ncbi:alpha-(1,3)-fucosyltransferase 11-like [Xenia sp. Carnegie-2017]|uniref:alpha-(1,3)-fucosyltransferase 11-like n=1 Tax=Xenia sp. Carnegie-2017 TaxID=2897299 RepID=UPI001F04CCFA|nr:alpha-(1,3)-fucosyltransferase 11-like [Xenia sp. Carnegie-2017]